MRMWRRFRGMTDRKLQLVLGGHQQLHQRMFVWLVFAHVWLVVLTVVAGLHLAGLL